MRVALDIDETITCHPEFFAVLSRAFTAGGHEIFIITYREASDESEAELAEYGIVYDELITATNEELDRTGFYEWKARICRERKIDILFEDMPEVINRLDPTTIGCMVVDPSLGRVRYEADE
jgi:hypothetical protein